MVTNKLVQTAVWAVDGIGLKTYRRLESYLHQERATWTEWWSAGSHIWGASGLKSHQLTALQTFKLRFTPETYYEYLQNQEVWVLAENEPTYPALLFPLNDRPPILFGRGRQLFSSRAVAVVGTRHITSYGRQVTTQLVSQLVAASTQIISGFMYGVDAVAHQTAHQLHGQTIGVLGFGFESMFPAHHQALFEQLIAEGQTFVTEYAPHVRPNKGTFICRNRLIAGLSQGVVITEAGMKSGSHSTAHWAANYGRSICAVPGAITNPYSQGTKWLINQGARLVSDAQDVFDELGWVNQRPITSEQVTVTGSGLETRILAELAGMKQSTDQLVASCQLSLSEILTTLMHLELAHQVRKEGPFWTLW